MSSPLMVFRNHALLCALLAWFFAQVIKVALTRGIEHRWDFSRMFGSGGMPSSHTSFVVALGVMIGQLNGYDSTLFAMCFIFACVVMVDATGVRRETGTQATVINQILKDVLINGKKISDEELKELVGHTPFEVLCGFLLGIITAVLYIAFVL